MQMFFETKYSSVPQHGFSWELFFIEKKWPKSPLKWRINPFQNINSNRRSYMEEWKNFIPKNFCRNKWKYLYCSNTETLRLWIFFTYFFFITIRFTTLIGKCNLMLFLSYLTVCRGSYNIICFSFWVKRRICIFFYEILLF